MIDLVSLTCYYGLFAHGIIQEIDSHGLNRDLQTFMKKWAQ